MLQYLFRLRDGSGSLGHLARLLAASSTALAASSVLGELLLHRHDCVGGTLPTFCRQTLWQPMTQVALPDTKAALGKDKKAPVAIWSDGVARYASYF